MVARMPDDVPRDMPHMCRQFPGSRTFIPSNPPRGGRCSLYAASERRPTSGGVPLLARSAGPQSSPLAARWAGLGGTRAARLNRLRDTAAAAPDVRCSRDARPSGNQACTAARHGGRGGDSGAQRRRHGKPAATRSLRISSPQDKEFRRRSTGAGSATARPEQVTKVQQQARGPHEPHGAFRSGNYAPRGTCGPRLCSP
jgi:hypothetical protein